MAANDFAAQNGTEKLSTNALSTVNGVSVVADVIEVQRIKNGFGVEGALRDVSGAFPLPVDTDSRRSPTYFGRASTFRIPGRAGTAGQKLFSIHNATGSAVLIDVEKLSVDLAQTVVKAVTVLPPIIRLYRVTVLPTNGAAVTKSARDTSLTSSASATVLQDASADGVSATTTLTATLIPGSVITLEYAPRLITAAGYEVSDRVFFLEGEDERVTLRPLEGLVVMLDYTLATQNPITDMWIVNCKWTEYTVAP